MNMKTRKVACKVCSDRNVLNEMTFAMLQKIANVTVPEFSRLHGHLTSVNLKMLQKSWQTQTCSLLQTLDGGHCRRRPTKTFPDWYFQLLLWWVTYLRPTAGHLHCVWLNDCAKHLGPCRECTELADDSVVIFYEFSASQIIRWVFGEEANRKCKKKSSEHEIRLQ